jgi:ribosome-associated protein
VRAERLRAEARLRTSRSSGPGGQHANVTASRVEAVLDVRTTTALNEAERARVLQRLGPVVAAVAQDERSQLRNRELALDRLEAKVARALHVPRPRRATRPTRASQERRLQAKRAAAQRKAGRRRPPDAD